MIGTPSEEDIKEIKSTKSLRYLAARMQKPKPRKKFSEYFNGCDELGKTFFNIAIDLMEKIFVFNPSKRISIEEALNHPFLAPLHFEEDEPIVEKLNSKEFEFEFYDFTLEQFKGFSSLILDLIYEEILLYHSIEFKQKYFMYYLNKSNPFDHILKNPNSLVRADDPSSDEISEEEVSEGVDFNPL